MPIKKAEKRKTNPPYYREESVHKLGEEFSIEDVMNIGTAVRLGIGDLPPGPEPGPRMPRKKRPQIP